MASKTFETIGVLGLYTETPLHCGSEGGTGYVDLPIQRERHTQYPVIPGSTIKGVLKDELDLADDQKRRFFGAEEEREGGVKKKDGNPGTVSFGDGIVVAFPIRSSGAPFHWVTCPFVLERVFRILAPGIKVDSVDKGKAWGKAGRGEVLLEEIRVEVQPAPSFFGQGKSDIDHLLSLLPASGFDYIRQILPYRFLVVSDEDFKELVERGTEILTRIKLNVFGTTSTPKMDDLSEEDRARIKSPSDLQGNMFVEEVVPPETLFMAPLRAGDGAETLVTALKAKTVIRLGGDETIGRGITRMSFVSKATAKKEG